MAASLVDLLARMALASCVALALVLLLRAPLRRWLGAAAAFQAWLMVPVAIAAAALPSVQVAPHAVAAFVPSLDLASLTAPALHGAQFDWQVWLLGAWLGGVLATWARMLVSQRRFASRLGPLEKRGKLWFAASAGDGPALVGLYQPRIVVPSDFEARYDAHEQSLIITHEERHAARRDPLANLVAALLQCGFWFNPLMHYAAARYRFDQELACDADVMALHPGSAKAYAGTMLKTQEGGAPALATCHWQSSHPLKERIMFLKITTPTAARRFAARLAIAALVTTSAMASVMARADTAPGTPAKYTVAMTIDDGNGVSTPTLLVREGESFVVASSRNGPDQAASELTGDMLLTDAGNGKVTVAMKLKINGDTAGEPRIELKLGETGGVGVSGKPGGPAYKLTFNVAQYQPGPAPQQ